MERSVGRELRTVSNMIRRRLDNSRTVKDMENMTGTHGWVVGYLFEHRDRDVFQRDFEEEFHIRRSSATKILQLMEKNGLIIRQGVDYDARLKKIVLTPMALSMHEAFRGEAMEMEKRILRGIPEENLKNFFETLDMMKRNIENDNEVTE